MRILKKVEATINLTFKQYINEVEYVSAGVTKNAFLQGIIEGTLYMTTPLSYLILTILFN